MKLYIKDGVIYNPSKGILNGDYIVYNPSEDQMRSWGYELYVPKAHEPTERELIEQEIGVYKERLFNTDYIALKAVEGYDCDSLYPGWKQHRKEIRDRINELEQSINDGDNIGLDTE